MRCRKVYRWGEGDGRRTESMQNGSVQNIFETRHRGQINVEGYASES
jgi:hypothetical protein